MALNYYETIIILDDRITETDYKAIVEHYIWYFTEELKGIIKDVESSGLNSDCWDKVFDFKEVN